METLSAPRASALELGKETQLSPRVDPAPLTSKMLTLRLYHIAAGCIRRYLQLFSREYIPRRCRCARCLQSHYLQLLVPSHRMVKSCRP
jgi:hypothetical protein